MLVCKIDWLVTACYSFVYLLAAVYVTLRNRCNLNYSNHFLILLYLTVYCSQLVAVSGSITQDSCFNFTWYDKLLLFEADVFQTIVLQLVVYRMVTLRLRFEDDPNGDMEIFFKH